MPPANFLVVLAPNPNHVCYVCDQVKAEAQAFADQLASADNLVIKKKVGNKKQIYGSVKTSEIAGVILQHTGRDLVDATFTVCCKREMVCIGIRAKGMLRLFSNVSIVVKGQALLSALVPAACTRSVERVSILCMGCPLHSSNIYCQADAEPAWLLAWQLYTDQCAHMASHPLCTLTTCAVCCLLARVLACMVLQVPPIKETGSYECSVRLHPEVNATFRIKIEQELTIKKH